MATTTFVQHARTDKFGYVVEPSPRRDVCRICRGDKPERDMTSGVISIHYCPNYCDCATCAANLIEQTSNKVVDTR